MTVRLMTIGMLSAAALLVATPVFAQLPPARAARPARTLFGQVKPASERLTVGASFAGGYDDDLTAVIPGEPPVRSGQFLSAVANAGYTIDKEKVRGDLSFSAGARYYGDGSPPLTTYNGGGSVSVSLSKNASMTGTIHTGSYLDIASIFGGDAYGSNPFSSSVPLVPIESGIYPDGNPYDSFHGGIQFGYQVNARVNVGGGYSYYANNAFTSASHLYGSQSASGAITVDLGKGFGLRAGYGYTDGGFGTAAGVPTYSGHSFDGGLTYGQSLSVTRRSTLSFATSVSSVTDQTLEVRVFAGGTASFTYEIGRSWDAGVHYSRGVNFYQLLAQPTFSDTLTAGIGGAIGRRIQVSGTAGVIFGTVGVAGGSPGYDTANASGGMRVGLSRHIGLSVNYAYYRYQYDSSVILPPGMSNSRENQVVRVSFDVWASVYERARRANATR